jgi:hypothetical protein
MDILATHLHALRVPRVLTSVQTTKMGASHPRSLVLGGDALLADGAVQ